MKTKIGFLALVGVLLLSPIAESGLTFSIKEHCEADDKEPWSYHGHINGPGDWGETFSECYGQKQSPIDINTEKVKPDSDLEKLTMNNYDKPVTKAKIINNGHSAQIVPQDGVSRTIKAEGKTFTLQQLHFHWGTTYYEGSEHTLDDQQYAMEGHLVHTNEKGEIAVVGVIFQARDTDNEALLPITDALPSVPYKSNEAQLQSELNLNDFVPENPSSFYRYFGSLTTPGCSEGVVWSLLKGIQTVGVQQMKAFRSIYSTMEEEASDGCKMVNNFRPVQPLNDRVVYSSL